MHERVLYTYPKWSHPKGARGILLATLLLLLGGCGANSQKQGREVDKVQKEVDEVQKLEKALRVKEKECKKATEKAVSDLRAEVERQTKQMRRNDRSSQVSRPIYPSDNVGENPQRTPRYNDEQSFEPSVECSLNPQEILNIKLNNPHAELSPNQSISLIDHCAQLGEQNATLSTDRETCLFLGNTGAGKSTTVNCLMGCEMKLVKPSELNLSGVRKVVMVEPGSTRAEVMPIGHGGQSRTFMPQIAPDPDNSNKAYCDCPGFSDNRGAEINIANAINTSRVLQQARGVKAVFLAEYADLIGSWGNNTRALENMCDQLFGSAENLRRHQNSVLLGITKAPFYEDDEPVTRNMVQSLLTQVNTPTAQILAQRIFLFDPLDRGGNNPDFWSIEYCRNEIDQLASIPQREATTLFQTVLTDSDRTHLLNTIRQLRPKISHAITQGDSATLGRYWQLLQRLRVINHQEIEQLMQGEVLPTIDSAILQRVDAFKDDATVRNFDDAERALKLIIEIKNNLLGAPISLDINALNRHLECCRKLYAEQQARERELVELRIEIDDPENDRSSGRNVMDEMQDEIFRNRRGE
jgi:energy-coupling factor transporter ATP-binding protein EcfA2